LDGNITTYPDATNGSGSFVNNGDDFLSGSDRSGYTTLTSKANARMVGESGRKGPICVYIPEAGTSSLLAIGVIGVRTFALRRRA
jgi:hypothetical protein